jgi:serine/threonine-protein kinase RsbW
MGQPQRLIVPGRFDRLTEIAAFITEAAREAGLGDDDVFHVEMAVDEACSNIIEHAYAHISGDIDLLWTCPGPGQMEIVIHDSGEPFDPDAVPLPPIGRQDQMDDLNEGGLGLYFIRKLMDEVRFEFTPGQGNTLYLAKRRVARPES